MLSHCLMINTGYNEQKSIFYQKQLFLLVNTELALCFRKVTVPSEVTLRTFIVDRSWRQIIFRLFELTILVMTISISRKKLCLPWFPGGHFLRGLITKSYVLSIFNISDDRFFYNLNSILALIQDLDLPKKIK